MKKTVLTFIGTLTSMVVLTATAQAEAIVSNKENAGPGTRLMCSTRYAASSEFVLPSGQRLHQFSMIPEITPSVTSSGENRPGRFSLSLQEPADRPMHANVQLTPELDRDDRSTIFADIVENDGYVQVLLVQQNRRETRTLNDAFVRFNATQGSWARLSMPADRGIDRIQIECSVR